MYQLLGVVPNAQETGLIHAAVTAALSVCGIQQEWEWDEEGPPAGAGLEELLTAIDAGPWVSSVW